MRQSSHPIAAFKSNVVAVLQSIMPVLYCIVTESKMYCRNILFYSMLERRFDVELS